MIAIKQILGYLVAVTALMFVACSGGGSQQDTDTETESETESESESETQTETDTETDTGTGTDTGTDTGNPWVDVNFSVLTYNVGNPDSDDEFYPLRLSSQDYEDFMAAKIQSLGPDVVFLQEVLSGKTCESFTETDPDKTCYHWDTRPRPAKRLLGDDYTVVCDQREQVECVGVHTSFGTIDGMAPGEYDDTGAHTPALPLDPCIWADGECTDDLCDAESTVSAVTAHTDAGPLRLVHMHPMAQVSATVSGDLCRAYQLLQVFEGDVIGGEDSLLEGFDRSIVAGDWNLGLEIYWARTLFSGSDAAMVWEDYVNCGTCEHFDIDPRNDSFTRYSTTSAAPAFLDGLGLPIAIDHVVLSDGIAGDCTIFDTGGMESTVPLDEGYPSLDDLGANERIDHYGIMCEMTMSPSGE